MTLPGHASPDTTVEDATAALLSSYTPQALTAEQWAAAGDAVRTLIVTAHPTTLGVARTLLSVVTGLLAHIDAWDKTNAPRWSDILTDAVIDRYVTSHQRGATRGVFRSELRQLARGAGTIPRRAHTPCIRPVDPTLLAAATQPIPVAAYPALWTAAHGTRMPVEKLVPVVAELARQAKQAKATARTRRTITVWSLPAPIRELAEANDQPVRETVTSTGGTTTRATRPLSRRAVKAHAHAQRAAREARTGTGKIPTAPAIDAPIQATIDAYRPWLKVRGTWDANRDVAHRLVTGFNPASARNAQHACSYIAKFLHWYAGHAGRNPQQPITLEELTKPGLVDAYITAYTGTDKSKATMRSALRRALGSLTPAGRSPILPSSIVSPPYTPAECAALVRLARHQPTPTLTAVMSFIVGLGLGAGLDSRDMRHLTRNDFAEVHLDSSAPVLTVTVEHGDRPRTVPVRHAYADLVRRALELHEATGKDADALLLGHTVGRNNVAGNFLAEAKTVDPNGVQLTITRLRNTWLVAVMSSPLPLADVLRVAGLTSGRTITDLLPYCPATPAADAERILAGFTPDAGDAP